MSESETLLEWFSFDLVLKSMTRTANGSQILTHYRAERSERATIDTRNELGTPLFLCCMARQSVLKSDE